ncbi:MAG: SWIB/MDM2 domain-containing protein [archaeon]
MAAKRKPFGGMMIAPDAKLGVIIGHAKVAPSQMTKKIWQYIKAHKLMKK